MVIHRIVAGVCLALVAGCTLPFSGTRADAALDVEAGPAGVVIRNVGERPALYIVSSRPPRTPHRFTSTTCSACGVVA